MLPDFDRLEISKEFVDENHDILAKHSNSAVRALVAHYGHNLEELSNDSANHVRRVMARDGYYTDKFLKDTDPYTREEAIKYLKRSGKLDKDEIKNLREKSNERKNLKGLTWRFGQLTRSMYSAGGLSNEGFNEFCDISDRGSEIMSEINNNADKTSFMHDSITSYNALYLYLRRDATPQEKARIRDNSIATLKTYRETCNKKYAGSTDRLSYDAESLLAIDALYVKGYDYLDNNEKRFRIYNDIPEEYLNILKSKDHIIRNGGYDFIEAPKQN